MTTKTEKAYLSRIAELPCAACGSHGVQIHHIREGQGVGQRAGNGLVIPLCPECHLGDFSIHKSRQQFTNIYGSELDLLNETILGAFGEKGG